MGGSVSNPSKAAFAMPSNSLQRGHWYDLVFHFVWSASTTTGKAEAWIDGKQLASTSFPTLYTRSDGSSSYNTFGLYNYRLTASWDSVVYFDSVRIGSSQAAVL